MFTKDEKKRMNTEFWTCFGIYMKKHNTEFGRIKWVNYKTNVKDIYVRLVMKDKKATFAIEIQHKDPGIRSLFYEQFTQLQTLVNDLISTNLIWEEDSYNTYNESISKIHTTLGNVKIYNKNDWQKTFQFFEQNMVGFHQFWIEFNEVFKQLES